MQNDPEAARELEALGLRVLPVTVVGARTVLGFDVPALKELFDIDGDVLPDLSASELLEKYRIVYEGAKRAVLQIPDDKLDWVTPKNERSQTLRVHAYHLFDRPEVYMDAAQTGHQCTFEMCQQYRRLGSHYRTTRDIVDYADRIMSRLEAFLANQPHLFGKVVETYFGPKTVGELLNLALSGTAVHTKQLYHFLRAIGVEPQSPLGEKEFAGIHVLKKTFG